MRVKSASEGLDLMPVKLNNSEIMEAIFGSWSTFHDAEILSILLDQKGPSITFRILIAQYDPTGATDKDGYFVTLAHYETALRFGDIENLTLHDFNYQNVIHSLRLSRVTEERFASGRVEERIKVEIDSVFGAICSFTCGAGAVLNLEETELRLGNPKGYVRSNKQSSASGTEGFRAGRIG